MTNYRKKWVPIICAISTYGQGFGRGTTSSSNFKIGRNTKYEKRRKKQSLEQNKTNVEKDNKEKMESTTYCEYIPKALRRCNFFAWGKCAHGNKCKYSHAPELPLQDDGRPYVHAEIYFKSLPDGNLTEDQMRAIAEQFGQVYSVVYYRNQNCPNRVAGKVIMTNEAAAKAFTVELDNKVFETNNGNVYVKAQLQQVMKVDKDKIPDAHITSNQQRKQHKEQQHINYEIKNSTDEWPSLSTDEKCKEEQPDLWKTVTKSATKRNKQVFVPAKLDDAFAKVECTSPSFDDKLDDSGIVEKDTATPTAKSYQKSLLLLDWAEFDRERLREREQLKKASWSKASKGDKIQIVIPSYTATSEEKLNESDDSSDEEDCDEPDYTDIDYYTNMGKVLLSKNYMHRYL